jgi:hypothetical protein
MRTIFVALIAVVFLLAASPAQAAGPHVNGSCSAKYCMCEKIGDAYNWSFTKTPPPECLSDQPYPGNSNLYFRVVCRFSGPVYQLGTGIVFEYYEIWQVCKKKWMPGPFDS